MEVDSENEAKELEKKFKNEFLALLIKKTNPKFWFKKKI